MFLIKLYCDYQFEDSCLWQTSHLNYHRRIFYRNYFTHSFEDTDSEYLIHRSNGEQYKYDNYYKKHFLPLMEQLGMNHTPHCCRYTCSSMMHKAEIRETIRKKILGHSQDLINKTYTQLDIDEIVSAINLI